MFRYLSKLYEDTKISAYNYFNRDSNMVASTKIYQTLQPDTEELIPVIANIDEKQLRIDTLLYIKQFKNTYYKYTNKDKFSPELYNSFIKDDQFDGGLTAFDDDDDNVRIFDKYILEYIKNRNDLVTYLQCKNRDISYETKIDDLKEVSPNELVMDIVFIMDMNEKDLFNYCYSIIHKTGNIQMIKNIIFSFVLKYESEYIRIKLSTFNKNKNNHPYLILERFIR